MANVRRRLASSAGRDEPRSRGVVIEFISGKRGTGAPAGL
jgi:hypothetical protein